MTILTGFEIKAPSLCPVCGHSAWCFSVKDDSVINCKRITPGGQPVGWRYLKDAEEGWIYSSEEISTKAKGSGQSVDGILGGKYLGKSGFPELARVTSPTPDYEVFPGEPVQTYYYYGERSRMYRIDTNPKVCYPQHLKEGSELFTKGLGEVDWSLFNLEQIKDYGAGQWLLWLEGEKCCVLASQLGLLATTAQTSKLKKADYLQSKLLELKPLIAGVCICPDNDSPGDKNANYVVEACKTVGIPYVLLSRQDLYEPLELPQKSDIEQIAQKLDNKGVYEFFQNLFIQTFNTVDTGTVQTGVTQELADKVKAEMEKNKLTAYDVVDLLKDQYKEKFCYSFKFKSWYEWTGTHWTFIDSQEFQDSLHFDIKGLHRPTSPNFYEKLIGFFKSELRVKGKIDYTQGGYLNFQNGCLDFSTGKLFTPTSKDWLTSCLPRDYSIMDVSSNVLTQLARSCPVFWNWANEAMGDPKKVLLLLSCINGVLTNRFSKYQRFIWLYGVPQSGKGTFTRLLTALVGKKYLFH